LACLSYWLILTSIENNNNNNNKNIKIKKKEPKTKKKKTNTSTPSHPLKSGLIPANGSSDKRCASHNLAFLLPIS